MKAKSWFRTSDSQIHHTCSSKKVIGRYRKSVTNELFVRCPGPRKSKSKKRRNDTDYRHVALSQVTSPMSTPGLDEVMAFLADRGYSRAASALLDDVLSRGGGAAVSVADAEPPENLPPLRMSLPDHASSSSDNDDDAFVSIHSSPGMLRVTRYLIY
ncbi:Dual specificity protein kinase pom1 [Carex littledalei]|uniref:Dual specificity protein kinase pom1 n=1 Tax=Carex littledalei TaxID=544730 RepID=A0A833QFX3_9POAL|nr:Dual specificity protein kinase pom1 [Carex littledalei]